MTAQIWNGDKLVAVCNMRIVAYNIMTYNECFRIRDKNIEDTGLRNWLYERALHFPWKGALPGEERPEAYLFMNAALHNFQDEKLKDGYRVSFPDEDYVSLYPADITYRHIHKLKR